MPNYFDAILYCNSEINTNGTTVLYLVEVGSNYSIKGIAAEELDKVGSDPHTLAPRYWPINDIAAFLANVERRQMDNIIFPGGQLTTEPLTHATIQSIGLYPTNETFVAFNDQVRKQIKEAVDNDKLTGDGLTMLVENYFYQRITSYNYLDLEDAWEELQETNAVKSRRGRAVITQLNITPTAEAYFIYFLTHDTFSFNSENQAYVKSLFSINKRYPSHFERFAIQVNFDDLLSRTFFKQLETTEDDSDVVQSSRQSAVNLVRGRFFSPPRSLALTRRELKEKLCTFISEYFKSLITRDNLRDIQTSWSDYSTSQIMGTTSRLHLAKLDIPKSEQHKFYRELSLEYPGMNSEHGTYLYKLFSHTPEFPVHACRFGGPVNLSDILLEKSQELFPEQRYA